MPKNIVIFSDGTGQAGGIPGLVPSNVYKLYRACPVTPGVQETFYDPGLGSPPDGARWRQWRQIYNLVSQTTGLGISWNIVDCYDALIKMYEPGDRIYLFGFSRGAYTVRSLGGMLALCGIPTRSGRGHDPRVDRRARRRLAWRALRWVYQTYGSSDAKRRKRAERAKKYRERYASHVATPYFIGVWDTVRWDYPGSPGSSRGVTHFTTRPCIRTSSTRVTRCRSTRIARRSCQSSGMSSRPTEPRAGSSRSGSPACTPTSAAATRRTSCRT
jgi:uncharacterized protein (DUF2235 family)